MKWSADAIGAVAQVNPKLAASDRPALDETVSFVPMAAVSEETLRIEVHSQRPFSEVSKGYTAFKRGDILVAKITPCFENGKMALAENLPHKLGFGTTEFHVFRPSPRITGSYLFNLLRAPYIRKAGAIKMKGAAGQRRVPADFFANLQIPLPPLAEQKRIAGILDAADALRAKRRESLAQLDVLLQSTFLDMFGDPVTNPMGWEVRPLQQLIQSDRPITYGILKPGPDIEGGVPYVRVVDIQKEQVLTEQLRQTTQEIARQYKRSQLIAGDLLMSIRGHVGRMAIVPLAASEANITQDTARLALSSADPAYVMQCLTTQGMQQHMARRTKGVAVKGINLGDVKEIPIPVPALDLQHRFTAIVESVEQQKTSQRAHLDELDTLFASLQSRAFRGDL